MDVAWRDVEGEAVLINADTGMMLVLNEVGSRVWEHCESPKDPLELAGLVADEFEVTPDAAENDIRTFLDVMIEKGLLVEAE